MSKTLYLLRDVVSAIVRRAHPGPLLEGEEALAWLQQDDVCYGKISSATGAMTAFSQKGAMLNGALARELRQGSPRYLHGVSLPKFAEAVASKVIAHFGPTPYAPVDAAALAALEASIDAWFTSMAVLRRHFVPCTILADRATSFDIGPVSFVHGADLASHPRGLAIEATAELTLRPLFRAMNERAATWIAIVEIDGCHPSRSSEMADMSVDVAIGALQLAIPKHLSERMARVTARTLPPWRGNLWVDNGQISPGLQNMESAHGLSGEVFDQLITIRKPLLDAAGHCVSAFTLGSGTLPGLQQAWCDAVYWFHEALAEPLDTVATAKLATAVEVLLRAEGTKHSGARMRAAIKAVSGLEEDQLIPGPATMTVKQFAASLVSARSRVLHGTSSTLRAELAASRADLTQFARHLLVVFAIQIEAYAALPFAKDDRDALLDWIAAQRAAAPDPKSGASSS